MKPGGGRLKGSAFERRVAAMIVATFIDLGVKKSDCFRTPLSGGHVFASKSDPGDLVISPKLRKWFPWHVECKAHAKVNLVQFMYPFKLWKKSWKCKLWMVQIADATEKQEGNDEFLTPLLVFKENNGEIMAVFPAMPGYGVGTASFKGKMIFEYKDREWLVVRFKTFLRKVKAGHDRESRVLRHHSSRREA